MKFAIIGYGRCGKGVEKLFLRAGVEAQIVTAKTVDGEGGYRYSLGEALPKELAAFLADETPRLMLLSLPDGLIRECAEEFATHADIGDGLSVIHASGALDVAELRPLKEKGAWTGAFHPNVPFASGVESPLISSVVFQGSVELARELNRLLVPIGVSLQVVESLSRPLYHAANVLAAGHVMTLIREAERLLTRAGLTAQQARVVLNSLVEAHAHNLSLSEGQINDLITGPFKRGDEKTLDLHRQHLAEYPELAELYFELGSWATR